jgi:hypothetical protein
MCFVLGKVRRLSHEAQQEAKREGIMIPRPRSAWAFLQLCLSLRYGGRASRCKHWRLVGGDACRISAAPRVPGFKHRWWAVFWMRKASDLSGHAFGCTGPWKRAH